MMETDLDDGEPGAPTLTSVRPALRSGVCTLARTNIRLKPGPSRSAQTPRISSSSASISGVSASSICAGPEIDAELDEIRGVWAERDGPGFKRMLVRAKVHTPLRNAGLTLVDVRGGSGRH